jgi:hypothetical protein
MTCLSDTPRGELIPAVGVGLFVALLVGGVSIAHAQDPARAQNLTGTVARNRVTLNWQAPAAPPAPVVGYRLDAGLSPGATLVSVPLGDVLTFSADVPDGIFFVRVQAVTAAGPTGPSNEISLAAGQAAPPAPPLSLVSAVAGNNVAVQWTENPAGPVVSSYLFQAGSASGLSDVGSVTLPPAMTSLAGAAPPGTYFVRVSAGNLAGFGPPSNEVVVVTQGPVCVPPGAPGGLVATTAPGGVALGWNPPSTGGAPTGYRIDAGTSPGLANLGTFPIPLVSTISTPAPAGTYFVRLVATNACGTSPPSNEVSFAIAPPVPTSLVGTWDGVVFNHPGSLGRGPIRSFVLRIDRNPSSGSGSYGLWTDNLGCKSTNVQAFFGTGGRVTISIESLACNDGDFSLFVTSAVGNVLQGTCRGSCTFRMTRR